MVRTTVSHFVYAKAAPATRRDTKLNKRPDAMPHRPSILKDLGVRKGLLDPLREVVGRPPTQGSTARPEVPHGQPAPRTSRRGTPSPQSARPPSNTSGKA